MRRGKRKWKPGPYPDEREEKAFKNIGGGEKMLGP